VRDERDGQFDAFVDRRYGSLLRTAYLLTGDRGAAEDLVQTALLETYRRWDRLDDRHDPVGYVRRVLVTTQTSWARRFSFRERVVAEFDEAAVEDASPVERVHLVRALGTLPARMRAVLVLRFYEDLTEAATAAALGCSVGTVKSQTSRGLARLRTHLDDGPRVGDAMEERR
jgi:RNA polymerase sigma-70 factor (sigma-E family)